MFIIDLKNYPLKTVLNFCHILQSNPFFFSEIKFFFLSSYSFFRYFPSVMSDALDQNLLTFILTSVCTPAFFKNPYLVSKLIEILFVINPAVQVRLFGTFRQFLATFGKGRQFSIKFIYSEKATKICEKCQKVLPAQPD